MRFFSSFSAGSCCLLSIVGFVAGSQVDGAPCAGSKNDARGRSVVRHAVVTERVVSGHGVRQVAFAEMPKDIVDTAVGAGTFKTLAAALGAAELVETLKGDGPFTVFAPTDEAFAKLPPGTVDTLLKPENKGKLKEILLLHVVPGNVLAADVVKITEPKDENHNITPEAIAAQRGGDRE